MDVLHYALHSHLYNISHQWNEWYKVKQNQLVAATFFEVSRAVLTIHSEHVIYV